MVDVWSSPTPGKVLKGEFKLPHNVNLFLSTLMSQIANCKYSSHSKLPLDNENATLPSIGTSKFKVSEVTIVIDAHHVIAFRAPSSESHSPTCPTTMMTTVGLRTQIEVPNDPTPTFRGFIGWVSGKGGGGIWYILKR